MDPINISGKISPEKIQQLLAAAREKILATKKLQGEAVSTSESTVSESNPGSTVVAAASSLESDIIYNSEQLRFISTASAGDSCVLIGAAGTGKTTCMRGTIESLIQSGRAGLLHGDGHRYLPDTGAPGIIAVSFTRRAVANLRRAMPDDMKANTLTIHKVLEYGPVYYEDIDPETGKEVTRMAFEPARNAMRPLPSSIKVCIIDEASMVSTELFKELENALPQNCQYIYLGDIQQLPPVFGSAILGFKILELPLVELIQVYRQALESPIIRLAHRILEGRPIPATEFQDWKVKDKLTLHQWKKKLHADTALLTAAKFFTTAIDAGIYDSEEDMILCPFNKSLGTIELNKHIAEHLSTKRAVPVYEIIAGFNKLYLSIGDRVLVEKEDAVVTGIQVNIAYAGVHPQKESLTLDYWGYNRGSNAASEAKIDSDAELDFILESIATGGADSEDRVRQASHTVTVEMLDSGTTTKLSSASELNGLLLSYALTVHKAQGSEWRKVFLVLHQSHSTMLQRELLYTAVTRAKEELYVICEPESFTNGIISQRIKGNTLAEKAEYFKGKIDSKAK